MSTCPRRSANLRAPGAVALLLAAACAIPVAQAHPPPAQEASMTEAMGLSPDIELEGRDGKPFRLADHLGKRVLVVTWASW